MLEILKTEGLYLLRVLIALLLGFAIGVERKIRYKEAGMRTHAIVAAGAALMTIVGTYGFSEGGGDSSRVAAQIVTGIGFLGAGIIMYRRDSLRGITTAAGIWATAGIGMAAGVGQWILAAGTTILIIILQCVLHLPIRFFKTKQYYTYRIKFICTDNENEAIKNFFKVKNYSRINYYRSDKNVIASAEIGISRIIADEEIKKIIVENNFITAIERIYQLDGKE